MSLEMNLINNESEASCFGDTDVHTKKLFIDIVIEIEELILIAKHYGTDSEKYKIAEKKHHETVRRYYTEIYGNRT